MLKKSNFSKKLESLSEKDVTYFFFFFCMQKIERKSMILDIITFYLKEIGIGGN